MLKRAEVFDESRYLHFAALSSTVDLFQSVYTSESGNTTSALVGEELLLWLNMNFVAPSNDEGPTLNSYEKPWLADEFWIFILRCEISCSLSNCGLLRFRMIGAFSVVFPKPPFISLNVLPIPIHREVSDASPLNLSLYYRSIRALQITTWSRHSLLPTEDGERLCSRISSDT